MSIDSFHQLYAAPCCASVAKQRVQPPMILHHTKSGALLSVVCAGVIQNKTCLSAPKIRFENKTEDRILDNR